MPGPLKHAPDRNNTGTSGADDDASAIEIDGNQRYRARVVIGRDGGPEVVEPVLSNGEYVLPVGGDELLGLLRSIHHAQNKTNELLMALLDKT